MKPVVDWLNGCIKEMNNDVFKNVIEVSDAEVTPMNDGQLVIISDINRVNLILTTASGEKRTLKAVSKFEPTSDVGKGLAQECEAFENEAMMYGDVLKSMEHLMSEVGDKDLLWPECYHCSDNKLLLQDLCDIGYSIVPIYTFLDLEHTLLVMKTLGKFHGLSMVMKERATLDTTKLKPTYLSRKLPFMINVHKMAINGVAEVIRNSWGPEWSSVPERMVKLIEDPGETMAELSESMKGKWDVLVHGDFSMRNMLFHYPPNSNKPDDVKFVDFQMCNYNNFGFDLTTFLYSSVLPQLREDNMDKILGAYAESLASTCKQYNFKGPVPSAEDAAASLKALSYLTTTISFCSYPFFIASGKMDMQKKVDEDITMFASTDAPEQLSSKKDDANAFYGSKEIEEILKYEITRCLKENIF